jgi:hypothetical protein
MADTEPPDEVSASSTEPRWPDPSRPIINEQQPGYQQGPPTEPLERRVPRPDKKFILPALLLLAAILVVVWLLWWR